MLLGIDASRAARPQRTGTEAYAYHLCRALIPAASARGHRLRFYFNEAPATPFWPDGAVDVAVRPAPRLWTHVRLAAELHRRPPDVFFTPAHVIPLTYRRAAVATVHDLGFLYFPESHTWRQNLYLRWSTRHNSRVGRRTIADSTATRDDLARFYGIAAGRIDVIHPGRPPDLSPVTDPVALTIAQARYGLQPPYLLYLGTLQPRKNLARLVRAFAAADVPHQLVLAGRPGWRSAPLQAALAALPAAARARVHQPGFIAEGDKAAVLSRAEALLFPSLYEGFGFPVLEAQACDTAVLCADNSSLPEVAGDAALFVDAGDEAGLAAAIRHIAGDAALRARLVVGGRANLARFDWAVTAERVLDTLERAAQEAPPGG